MLSLVLIILNYNVVLASTKVPAAQFYVNNELVAATRTDLSIGEYDAVAEYSFIEDEGAAIHCRGQNNLDIAMITYYDNTGRDIFTTKYIHIGVAILLKLTKDCDGHFIDCAYIDIRRDTSVTRLYLHLQDQNTTPSIIILHIDGMMIRTKPNVINYTYHHVYYEEEETEITCELRNDEDITLQWYHRGVWATKNVSQRVNETFSFKNHYDNTFVCAAMENLNNNVIESVIIRFTKSQSEFYVTGLVNANILKQYSDENNTYIYYQYTDYETLSLTCTKIRKPTPNYSHLVLGFKLNGESLASTVTSALNNNEKMSKYHVFALQPEQNNSVIECMWGDRHKHQDPAYTGFSISIYITLVYKKATVIVRTDHDNGNNANSNNNKNDVYGNKDNGNKDTDVNNVTHVKGYIDIDTSIHDNNVNGNNAKLFTTDHWIFISVGIGTLVIIIIMTCVIFRIKRNKVFQQTSENMNVTNTGVESNENGQLQAINQHYQNIDINDDGQTEPVLHYAEIMPMNNKAKYTKTYAPEYAQIISKDNHTNRNTNDYENICHSTRNLDQVDQQIAEPTYSEVVLTRE